MDGNQAAAHVSYAFTEVASIYPITPSSTMAEYVDEWSSRGRKNIFGQEVKVVEMQSEVGAAGAFHGALATGALASTYTASQGLLLMIPNMYKVAGEFLPGVMHVSARALATHALSIFGDHSDVMACSQTGFALLASESPQEVMDLAAVAHLASIKAKVPFLHFFDGFRTSHEQKKLETWEYDELSEMLDWDAVKAFKKNALNPEHPVVRGTNQNPDIFFQAREAGNSFYNELPAIVKEYMEKVSTKTGRTYKPFNYYGAADAEDIIIAMGSVNQTIEQVVEYLNKRGGKVGLLKVHLYRPFVSEYFFEVLPKTVKRVAVLDRLKTPGSLGEPLYQDICSVFYASGLKPLIIGGRYGLGSKDTLPADIFAVFKNLAAKEPKHGFTIGIVDDVYNTSLPRAENINLLPEDTIQCKFFGLGSDGTVGANKQAVDIINSQTELFAQAYFAYDSKKSGGLTVSHLRFGKHPIKAPYLISYADFISCSNQAYVNMYDILDGLKEGGNFLLNTVWSEAELNEKLPAKIKKYLAGNHIKFYIINAVDIAKELGLGNRINMIMQSAFFKLAGIIPEATAVKALHESIKKAYGTKGEKIVEMNKKAVEAGIKDLKEIAVPAEWTTLEIKDETKKTGNKFLDVVFETMEANKGDDLPVSAFTDAPDGTFPLCGSRYEKRGVASFVPEWIPENCIQCNQCSLVCPHAAIRPFLLTEEEKAAAPEAMKTIKATGKDFSGYQFKIQVSPLDCQGCGSCPVVCPAKEKALVMKPIATQETEIANWEYAVGLKAKDNMVAPTNIKNSQFQQPLLEFSGACAGCGETPYAKLITQLFGDRMIIGNATGCSSIWGAAVPAMPYCKNHEGKGPAWCNSLFEDNAEFSFGMLLGVNQQREKLAALAEEALESAIPNELKEALKVWLEAFDDGEASKAASAKLLPLLQNSANPIIKEMAGMSEYLVKKSVWAFGGDGWAYDIGYGGLDHVLASGADINVLVMDTEVYSNTGGQSSKATPTAAIAKFAASGKNTGKKDLGMMAMSYGYVYVAQIAIGADMNQTLKAIREAEAYPGPSLIIAYSSCINHGIKAGMNNAMTEMKKAVASGYWHLYRYNPLLKQEGKNPFTLDSKEPTESFRDFLMGEVRYASLAKLYPEQAEALFDKTAEDAARRYSSYLTLAEQD
ncbi:MAG: pyruvate:ferredoxin (flavodoxin) oxidoreductase [Clostridia bacterium]|nr:pyruvate:ferredoxin (flavodoxin) oxidoreductase [Clostridia bacterium]